MIGVIGTIYIIIGIIFGLFIVLTNDFLEDHKYGVLYKILLFSGIVFFWIIALVIGFLIMTLINIFNIKIPNEELDD